MRTVGPEGKTATEGTGAEILPIRRSGESKLDEYNCYCPRSSFRLNKVGEF